MARGIAGSGHPCRDGDKHSEYPEALSRDSTEDCCCPSTSRGSVQWGEDLARILSGEVETFITLSVILLSRIRRPLLAQARQSHPVPNVLRSRGRIAHIHRTQLLGRD